MPAQITQQLSFGQSYLDINALYGIDAQPELVQGVAAVQNALYNLFTTPLQTVPYLRAYGTQLMSYVYEPYDQITADDVLFSLYQAIGTWETRIIIDKRNSSIQGIPNNAYGMLVTIVAVLKAVSVPFTYQFQATPLT
jgi:phage baseplate assembly protein W